MLAARGVQQRSIHRMCKRVAKPSRLVRSKIPSRDRALVSRYARERMVYACRHSVLAIHRPRACRRSGMHRSGRGSGMMSVGAAGKPQHPCQLPGEAAEQDLPVSGSWLFICSMLAGGAAQSCQVIPISSSNATSSRHRKYTNTYSVARCVYWYTCDCAARQPPSLDRE